MAVKKHWINTPVTGEMKARVEKAAARNDMSVARYVRLALSDYMQRNREWSLPGPRKGSE